MKYFFHIMLGVCSLLLVYALISWLDAENLSWEDNASRYRVTLIASLLFFVSFYNYRRREKAD